MKIAQVSPLFESTPPKLYGGTERVVSYLTEELVRQGHEVTLFASGDSVTQAHLVPACERALRLDTKCQAPWAYQCKQLEQVFERAGDFDIIHFHLDGLHLPFLKRNPELTGLTTFHGRLDLPEEIELHRHFPDLAYSSISNSQRRPFASLGLHWLDTVYHGLPPTAYRLEAKDKGYLAFLGRISPEKGPVDAIQIAEESSYPLRMAAKVDAQDRAYYAEHVKPLLERAAHVAFLGEIGEKQKQDFLGGAKALLFPIHWPEPFGLVMIEALACGTPVIAYGRGSVPEVLEDGRSGFVVNSLEEAVEAVRRLDELDRREVRRAFEERFTSEKMAGGYLRIYERLTQERGDLGRNLGYGRYHSGAGSVLRPSDFTPRRPSHTRP